MELNTCIRFYHRRRCIRSRLNINTKYNTVMNSNVDFEVAKLLKSKCYNEPHKKIYNTLGELWNAHYVTMSNYDVDQGACCTAPNIIDVVVWLYEKHDIWINVITVPYSESLTYWRWECSSVNYSTRNVKWKPNTDYISPSEAYQGAIKYCLNNLL